MYAVVCINIGNKLHKFFTFYVFHTPHTFKNSFYTSHTFYTLNTFSIIWRFCMKNDFCTLRLDHNMSFISDFIRLKSYNDVMWLNLINETKVNKLSFSLSLYFIHYIFSYFFRHYCIFEVYVCVMEVKLFIRPAMLIAVNRRWEPNSHLWLQASHCGNYICM